MEREVEGVEMEMDTVGVEGVGVDRAHHASCVPVMTTTGHLRIALSEIALSESVSNRPEGVRSGEVCFSSNEVGPADAAVRWLRSSAGEFGSPTAAAATSNASRRTAIILSVLLVRGRRLRRQQEIDC